MKLRATRNGSRTTIVRVDDTDTVVDVPFIEPFNSTSAYRKAAAHFNVPQALIVDLVTNRLERNPGQPAEVDDTPRAAPLTFFVRQFTESGTGTPYATFDDALIASRNLPPDTNIEWDGIADWCALDVDFDADLSPSPAELLHFASLVRPVPVYAWLTRSDHLRLVYTSASVYTADELAAVAGYVCNERFPTAKLEFLHRTRKPKGDVIRATNTGDIEVVRRLLNQHVSGDDYADWLSARGFVPGGRYPHTQCPVSPNEKAQGNDCVQVGEHHIKCHWCAKEGRKFGSAEPGYFPLAALAGKRINTLTATCVLSWTHWAQARYVLTRVVPNPAVAERVYRALLKLTHGHADPRIPHVFRACEPIGILRSVGIWTTHAGEALRVTKDSAMIRALPACMYLDADSKVQVDASIADQLTQPAIDLTTRGYPQLIPIRGIQLTASQELPCNKLYAVVQLPELARPEAESRRPVYVPGVTDARLSAAFARLEPILPGLDRNLVLLLVAARGTVEHRSGKPAMIVLTGPTGSGKTAHVQIAAAICGDASGRVLYGANQERFRQAFATVKNNGAYVVFDEFFKLARQSRDAEEVAMESLLSFDEDTYTHNLYIGAVKFGSMPVMVWADNSVPASVMQHEQIGRRVYYHRLPSTMGWEQTLQAAGIREPRQLRIDGSAEVVSALNEILSYVIDTYFRSPVTDFAQVAESLSFKLIRDCGGVEDKVDNVSRLYELVCSAPAITDAALLHNFSKRGLKLLRADSGNPLYEALNDLWSDDERGTASCRAIGEMDLARSLRLSRPCRFEIRRKTGSTLAVRFVSLDDTLVNEELRCIGPSTSPAKSVIPMPSAEPGVLPACSGMPSSPFGTWTCT